MTIYIDAFLRHQAAEAVFIKRCLIPVQRSDGQTIALSDLFPEFDPLCLVKSIVQEWGDHLKAF